MESIMMARISSLKFSCTKGSCPKKVPAVTENGDPKEGADNVKENETMIGHGANAGDKRGECSHNGDESGNNDGFASVFLKKVVGFNEVRGVEK